MSVAPRNEQLLPAQLVAMEAPDGFVYVPGFLTPSAHDELLDRVRCLRFEHDVFRGRRLMRSWAQFGFRYFSTGRRPLEAPPLPPFLARLVKTGGTLCPNYLEPFNQCIVTHYQTGAGIGWHTDAPRFGDVIMGISLGGPRRFQLRDGRSGGACCEIVLARGSLHVLHGRARSNCQHRIVPVTQDRW